MKEQPKKEVKKEEKKQVNNNPITYSSKGLGIAFDMPAGWRDKYAIKDDGTTIRVYMKHQDNFNSGIGFLFLITSDINSYSGGQDLDSIGGKKRLNIGGKEYLVGGPLDFRMYENDPLIERFKSMVRQTGQVVSTIRQL